MPLIVPWVVEVSGAHRTVLTQDGARRSSRFAGLGAADHTCGGERPRGQPRARAAALGRERRRDVLARSPLSDQVKAALDKGAVFALLRKPGGPVTDSDTSSAVQALYPQGTDDRWLAERLIKYG